MMNYHLVYTFQENTFHEHMIQNFFVNTRFLPSLYTTFKSVTNNFIYTLWTSSPYRVPESSDPVLPSSYRTRVLKLQSDLLPHSGVEHHLFIIYSLILHTNLKILWNVTLLLILCRFDLHRINEH